MGRRTKPLHTLYLALVGMLLAGSPHALQSQALPTATGPGSYLSAGVSASAFQVDYGKRWMGGGTGFVDANLSWRYGLEAEARSLRYNSESGVRQATYLVGPRVSFRPGGLIPYAKVLVGAGIFDYPYGYAKGTYLVIDPGAGLDYELTPRINLRLIDLEYQSWQNFTFGGLHPYGVSVGFSVKLLRSPQYPRELSR